MKKAAFVLCAALALTGCTGLQKLTQPFANPVSASTLTEAEASYAILLSAANAYHHLPRCQKGSVVVCKQPSVVVQLKAADRKAQAAFRAAENFVDRNPTFDPTAALFAVQAAVTDFQAVLDTYKIKAK